MSRATTILRPAWRVHVHAGGRLVCESCIVHDSGDAGVIFDQASLPGLQPDERVELQHRAAGAHRFVTIATREGPSAHAAKEPRRLQ
jgi:hypothetical protein